MELKGKKAIVTGSSRGIGEGIAIKLAEDGADIVINYFKDKDGAEKVSTKIKKKGRDCIIVQADVSEEEGAKRLITESTKVFGQIDILVNNAGGALKTPEGDFTDMPMEYWRKQIDLNLNAAVYCSKFVLKHMIGNKIKGKIINIGSVHSEVTFSKRKLLPYSSAKAGLNMLTKGLAVDFAKYGINVNCVAPGLIVTHATEGRYDREWWDVAMKRIPMGRAGTPEEVANLVLFLVTEKASYITGQTIFIDGGYLFDGIYPSLIKDKR